MPTISKGFWLGLGGPPDMHVSVTASELRHAPMRKAMRNLCNFQDERFRLSEKPCNPRLE